MQFETIGLTPEKIRILEKKKIGSVEAFLRKPPLHYWDFTKTLPLMLLDKELREKLAYGIPFAIIGTCTSFAIEPKDHMMMIKMRICEEKTKSTLFVNIMSSEALKTATLEHDLKHPVNNVYPLPDDVIATHPISKEGINAKCKKAIEELNAADKVTAKSLIDLKTFGFDSFSRLRSDDIEKRLDAPTVSFIRNIFPDGNAVSCFKWVLRGLNTELAIRKTLCDTVNLKEMFFSKKLIVGGNINYNEQYNSFSVLNPPVISWDIDYFRKIYVQYSQMKGFPDSDYRRYTDLAINKLSSFDIIPDNILKSMDMPSTRETAMFMHHPSVMDDIQRAKKRVIFDDLLYLAIKLKLNSPEMSTQESPKMPLTGIMEDYISSLPFRLTNGQENAIRTISERMKEGKKVSALVQGDVGTGKTCVAITSMLQAAENGFQAALAAPYTTLAWQHYRDISKIAEALGLKAVLLTSEMTAAEKRKTLSAIADGSAQLIVGTHSIFTKAVEYKNLGLIIEDEEHKFGVIHRENFTDKGVEGCHKITMSATPIPKSIADTLYGEGSEIITITDKPAERLKVKTAVTGSDAAAAKEIIKQVKSGHQAYIVCPAIEKNDKSGINASIETKEKIYRAFLSKEKKPDGSTITMSVLTGKMKAAEKTKIMEDFANGKTDVLMATTVIEVGMNVPNATIIVITGSDRFGFSTLHQLRGRVGRGSAQSYCVLQTDQPNEKLMFMQQTTDGFEIAEKDLEMRGPGSLFGEKQTGNNYFINLMLAYPKAFEITKKIADNVCKTETGNEIIKRYEEIYLSEEER